MRKRKKKINKMCFSCRIFSKKLFFLRTKFLKIITTFLKIFTNKFRIFRNSGTEKSNLKQKV
jgi:hypothetical protein